MDVEKPKSPGTVRTPPPAARGHFPTEMLSQPPWPFPGYLHPIVTREPVKGYRRRLLLSIGLSLLLNFAFLWLALSPGFSNLMHFEPMPKPKQPREIPKLVLVERPPPEPEMPRPKTFLETDESQKSLIKPRDAEFYSEHDTVATQTAPSAAKPGDVPKSDGQNTKTMATETVRPTPKSPSSPSSPAPREAVSPKPPAKPPPPAAPQPSAPKAPAEMPKTGEYALLRTAPPEKIVPKPVEPQPETPSPPSPPPSPSRMPSSPSVAPPPADREVMAAKSKLDGGVSRIGATAFNSAESPFASYDKKIIGKISGNWHYLLENRFYGETTGQVEISFRLLASGRISGIQITRNSANAVLAGWCIQAIERSAPFAPFPDSLRALVGDSREASITFNY